MTNKTLTVLSAITLLLVLLPSGLDARRERVDFAADVVSRNADTTPAPAVSNIDEYTFQDEQINIAPTDGIVKVLRTNQKALINDFVTALIPVRNANPRELRGPIRTMVRKEGGEADVVQDKTNGRNYLHVVCPRFQLPYVEDVIAGLDEQWVKEREDGSGELYYQGKFRDIRDIQRITQFYIGPEGMGRFFFDDINNAMYYTDQPALMGLQKWGLEQVDIPPNQVNLEVSVYEIDANNDTLLGLDFKDWKNGPGRNVFEFNFQHTNNDADEDNDVTDDWQGVSTKRELTFFQVNAIAASQFIDAVKNKGYVRELVRTNVTVKSGDRAVVDVTDSVLQFNSNNPGDDPRVNNPDLVDDDGNPVMNDPTDPNIPDDPGLQNGNRNRTLDYREAGTKVGVMIELVPYVGLESMELDVDVEASSVAGYTPAGNPVIGTRQIEDYVRLVDGEPFVLGGLERETVVRRKNGFPLLHSVPVVGWLFGSETNAKRTTRIVVVIKPTFHVKSESMMEMPVEMETVRNMAEGIQHIDTPVRWFGFDQWLLD